MSSLTERAWSNNGRAALADYSILECLDMNKYRFHLLGLAHTKTNKDFIACAFTQKVLKMGKMLTNLGHTVYHYGAEGSDLQCTEDIVCVTDAEQNYSYENFDPGSNTIYQFNVKDFAYQKFYKRAITEIKKRTEPKDILLCAMGTLQKPIADAVAPLAIEMGIGYTGVFAKFRVFESYAWMHYIYGYLYPKPTSCDGKYYDCVIPNYFDPDDFEFSKKKDDYYLYMGRITWRKGIQIAAQVVEEIGAKLIVAGIGDLKDIHVNSPNVEHVGFVSSERRRELMKKAKALFVPTIYLEPFGGVNVEAQFSGTPPITSDWGGFVDTVVHGVTGYRCRTIDQFIWAAKNIDKIKPQDCRDWAMKNFSLDRVALMYQEYFDKIHDLFSPGKGFYELHPERKELDWLKKYYKGGYK